MGLDQIRSRGYSYLEEILFLCRQVGCRMGETPILFENRRSGVSKINPREVVEALLVNFKLGMRRIFHPRAIPRGELTKGVP